MKRFSIANGTRKFIVFVSRLSPLGYIKTLRVNRLEQKLKHSLSNDELLSEISRCKYETDDLYVFTFFIFSIFSSILIYNYGNNHIFAIILSIIGILRIFEIIISQIRMILFDPFTEDGLWKENYRVFSVQRSIILVLYSYIESIFWFSVIMMSISFVHVGHLSNSYLIILLSNFIGAVTLNFDKVVKIVDEPSSVLYYLAFLEIVTGLIMNVIALARFLGAMPTIKPIMSNDELIDNGTARKETLMSDKKEKGYKHNNNLKK